MELTTEKLMALRSVLRQTFSDARESLDVDALLDVSRTANRYGRIGWTEATDGDQAKAAASLIRLAEQAARAAATEIRNLSNERVFVGGMAG